MKNHVNNSKIASSGFSFILVNTVPNRSAKSRTKQWAFNRKHSKPGNVVITRY